MKIIIILTLLATTLSSWAYETHFELKRTVTNKNELQKLVGILVEDFHDDKIVMSNSSSHGDQITALAAMGYQVTKISIKLGIETGFSKMSGQLYEDKFCTAEIIFKKHDSIKKVSVYTEMDLEVNVPGLISKRLKSYCL